MTVPVPAVAPRTAPDERLLRADYDVLGVRVHVLTDDPVVLATVDSSYRPFRRDATGEPGAPSDRDATIDCRRRGGSRWDVVGGWRPMQAFTSRDMATIALLDRLVGSILRGLYAREAMTIHASTVEVRDGLLVMAAPSGGGKTTLALGLAARGHALLSDELAVVDPDGTIRAYPRAAHVRPDTLELIPELAFLADRPRHQLGGGNEWSLEPAELAERWGLSTVESGRLAGVVLIDGAPGAGSGTLTMCSPATTAVELTRASFAASIDFGATLGRFAALVADVPCARLESGPFGVSLDAIERMFGSAPRTGSSFSPEGKGAARTALFRQWRADRVRASIEATGGSMRPLIEPGDDLDVDFGADPTATGEVIVFSQGGRVVAHRIVGRRPDGRWITKGDAEPFATEDVSDAEILGVVRSIARLDGGVMTLDGGGRSARTIAAISRTNCRLERVARRHGPLVGIPTGLAARLGRRVQSLWTARPAQAGQVDSVTKGGEIT